MIKSLEGARGLAAVFVSLFHFGLAFYVPPIEYGYLFVDLFFVLSGFVITATYSQRITQLADLKPFLIRRFGRLFPLMVFATALYVLVFNLGILAKHMLIDLGHTGLLKNPDALAYMVPGMAEIGGTMVLVQGMGLFDHLILNKVSWSISVEFYTYLLFAVLWVALAGKSRVMVSVALAVAGIGVTIWATLGVHDCLNKGFCYALHRRFFPGGVLVPAQQICHMQRQQAPGAEPVCPAWLVRMHQAISSACIRLSMRVRDAGRVDLPR
jgi:peptidoglycan/LPS O-acetylase OafA/YrhL